jgi:Raf kinase inhibitor-like YbhB/YbcL family protein
MDLQRLAELTVIAIFMSIAIGCDSRDDGRRAPARQSEVPSREDRTGGETMDIKVESTAFANNEKIPVRYTADGQDVSPVLTWTDVPTAAQELALVCDDPDAPTPEPWVHWVIYKISPQSIGLPENVAKTPMPPNPAGAIQGKNSWGDVGYRGPAPPQGHGVHHYHFKVYALDQKIDLPAGADKTTLLSAMQGHVLAEGELVGTYER